MEAGTSSQPLPKKEKQQVPKTPRKQPIAAIVLPRIPEGVRVKSNLLGYVENIKYSDHDVTNTNKFLEFTKKVYLQIVGLDAFGKSVNQPLHWVAGLEKKGILGPLELPHFGIGQYASSCIKQLMVVTHGEDIWLDKLILIDVELIAHITGLSSRGMDPVQFLDDKTKDKSLAEEMKNKYGTDRGMRGIIIKRINDVVTQGRKNHGLQTANKISQGGSPGWGRCRLLAQGQTQGSMLQQRTNKTLTIIPFGNTYEADAISPEVAAGGVTGLKCL